MIAARALAGLCLSAMIAPWAQIGIADEFSDRFARFNTPELKMGREIWVENCMGCHGDGTAGAPVPLEAQAWIARIDQGIDTLYTHAIDGFFGPDDTMMPSRGGNEQLSDDEVKAAVDYMVAVALQSINAQQN